jgi:hypothetical protein
MNLFLNPYQKYQKYTVVFKLAVRMDSPPPNGVIVGCSG